MFSAIALTSVQVFTAVSSCSSIVVLHLLLGHPLLHCPWWGLQFTAFFLCGRGLLPQCMSNPLPFLYYDFNYLFFGYNKPSFEWTGKCVNALFYTLLYGLWQKSIYCFQRTVQYLLIPSPLQRGDQRCCDLIK